MRPEGQPAAPRHRILIAEADDHRLQVLTEILRPLAGTLDASARLATLERPETYDLIVVDYDLLDSADRELLLGRFSTSRHGVPLLLCSEGKAKDDYVALFGSRTLTNLLARDGQVDAAELTITVRKILNGNIFGIEQYFDPRVQPRLSSMSHSNQKDAILKQAEQFAAGAGVHHRLGGLFCTVADELITNALYNAPVDREGRRRYTHLPRTQEVAMGSGEEIQIKFCVDDRRLGISIADPFGSLTSERVLDYLAKSFRKGADQIDEKPGGAGLGLYYIFESLSHFVINLNPGQRTEMIGLLDVRGSYKDFAVRCKSFNVFVGH